MPFLRLQTAQPMHPCATPDGLKCKQDFSSAVLLLQTADSGHTKSTGYAGVVRWIPSFLAFPNQQKAALLPDEKPEVRLGNTLKNSKEGYFYPEK